MFESGKRSAYEVLQVRDDAEHSVIVAAYRVLAAQYHPDRNPNPGAERRMAELNWAYAALRTSDRRQVYDKARQAPQPAPAAVVTPPRTSIMSSAAAGNAVLDFGRYAGWSLQDLARHDPDYLRWLSRHSSGIRYRNQIQDLLARTPKPTPSDRMRTSR